MTGERILIMRQLSGSGFRRFRSGPSAVDMEVTKLFANRIQRRIRHLREQLLEVIEQRWRAIRQNRQRRVGSHRADGFFAVLRHRRHQDSKIFVRVAKDLLPQKHRFVIRLRHAFRRQIG